MPERPFGLRWTRSAGMCLALLGALAGAACSSKRDENKPVSAVRGQVFVKGKPAEGAFVLFVPAKEAPGSTDPRPRGTVDKDGAFHLSTFGDKDGAPPGDYVVTITWPGGVTATGQEEPEDKLLGRYADPATSKLRASVKEGPNELPPFQL